MIGDLPTCAATTAAVGPFSTRRRRKRKLCLQSVETAHIEYLNKLAVPAKEVMEDIAAKQDRKEEELRRIIDGEVGQDEGQRNEDERKAAATIQAVKEAQYRNSTRPMSRQNRLSLSNGSQNPPNPNQLDPNMARQNWKRLGHIARRAGSHNSLSSSSSEDENGSSLTPEEKQKHHEHRLAARREREQTAKMMDLQYFLEMVDHKHRYGSNLRAYHDAWKRADTRENFFYWLDYGEGREVDLQICSRERLDREQVRYLSREERLDYLVKVDGEGRLCWAKTGERIDTSTRFRDSIHGIVPVEDSTTPSFREQAENALHQHRHHSRTTSSSSFSSSSSSSHSSVSLSSTESAGQTHYANPALNKAKGPKKISHVSAAAILNHLLRKSVKKNTWIFVADPSYRLYVGIKQSGAFQHSSFLNGARISAAGLIKIKDGQLRSLSPLSGHYRPPTSSFRNFTHHLKASGVDTSRVSISKSYAVLLGLEGYVKTRKKMHRAKEKVLHPGRARQQEEEENEGTESARRERDVVAQERDNAKDQGGLLGSVRRMSLGRSAGGSSFLRGGASRPLSGSGRSEGGRDGVAASTTTAAASDDSSRDQTSRSPPLATDLSTTMTSPAEREPASQMTVPEQTTDPDPPSHSHHDFATDAALPSTSTTTA
ncbi:MAG: hypothetical protein M1819_001892 [Sarea resinae]|nr:MAG: hypothetical protein M1819_001892 [Sarea resinae]